MVSDLQHHGIRGMKWGVRRFQNKDGSLTNAGKKRYDSWADSKHEPSSVRSSVLAGVYAATGNKKIGAALDKSNDRDAKRWERAKKQKKLMKEYGKLEDQYTYGKNADAKKNAKLDKRMREIENELNAESDAKKAEKHKTSKIDTNIETVMGMAGLGYGAKTVASTLNVMGQLSYSTYKDNSSPAKTLAIQGMGYGSKALDAIGDILITSAAVNAGALAYKKIANKVTK